MQLRHLETKVGVTESTPQIEQRQPGASLEPPHSDARLAVAQMRLNVEKELFRQFVLLRPGRQCDALVGRRSHYDRHTRFDQQLRSAVRTFGWISDGDP
jgi:hypothetical protein